MQKGNGATAQLHSRNRRAHSWRQFHGRADGTRCASDTAMLPPRRVLAPVDFSPYSITSLTFAARLARQCGAELHVLHVQSPLLDAAAEAQHVDLQGETRGALAALTIDAMPPGDGARFHHVETGPASEGICAAASTLFADVIAVGPRGRSRLAATLLGSTTKDLLQRAPCPVAVVP